MTKKSKVTKVEPIYGVKMCRDSHYINIEKISKSAQGDVINSQRTKWIQTSKPAALGGQPKRLRNIRR